MAKTFGSSVRSLRWGSLAQVLAGLALSVACSSTPQVVNGGDDPSQPNGGTSGQSNSGGTGNNIDVPPPPSDAGSSNVDPGAGGDDNPDASVCGDGKIGPDEGCDDGNAKSGDGCDGTCKVENGYVCKKPGEQCVSTLVCGDGLPGPDEACDDGNTKSKDGCSADCTVEAGYSCAKYGEPCTETTAPVVCGNGQTEFGETCDERQHDQQRRLLQDLPDRGRLHLQRHDLHVERRLRGWHPEQRRAMRRRQPGAERLLQQHV